MTRPNHSLLGALGYVFELVPRDVFRPPPWECATSGGEVKKLTDSEARLVLGDKVADHLGIGK